VSALRDAISHHQNTHPITTEERAKLKAGIYLKWDGEVTPQKLHQRHDHRHERCLVLEAVNHLVEQIYKIDPFEAKVMTEWETRLTANKSWERSVQYFLREADKLKIHKKATAKKASYHSAANVQEEAERAAEQEEQVNMVLEAMEKNGEQRRMRRWKPPLPS
jgi:hypothetical protein